MRPILLVIISLLFLSARAQMHRSWYGSNYGGLQAVSMNPAMLADNRYEWQASLFQIGVDVQNNYLQLRTPYSQYKAMSGNLAPQFIDSNGVALFRNYMLEEKINGRKKYGYLHTQISGPAFMMNFKDRSGIAISYSLHTEFFAAGLNESLLKIFTEDFDDLNPAYDVDANQKRLMGQVYEQKNFGVGAHAYASWNFSYAREVYESPYHYAKAGITFRRLHGFGGGYFNVNRLGYRASGIDTVQFTDPEFEYAWIDDQYYSDYPVPYSFNHPGRMGRSPGRGVGANLGVVYEYRPTSKGHNYRMNGKIYDNREMNKYAIRAAVSLNNIGRIRYRFEYLDSQRNQVVKTQTRTSSYTGMVQWNDFDQAGGSIESSEDFDSLVSALFGKNAAHMTDHMVIRLPMALNIQLDYHLRDQWYLGVFYTQSLRLKDVSGIRYPNMLSVQGRYEKRRWEVGGSITMGNFYQWLHVGLSGRYGPFFIGTDQLGSFLSSKRTNGLSFYVGLQGGIPYRKHKDSDGDGVSDDQDECKSEPGTLECKGCPDRDFDGVPDKEDKCPDEYGDYEEDGCPVKE